VQFVDEAAKLGAQFDIGVIGQFGFCDECRHGVSPFICQPRPSRPSMPKDPRSAYRPGAPAGLQRREGAREGLRPSSRTDARMKVGKGVMDVDAVGDVPPCAVIQLSEADCLRCPIWPNALWLDNGLCAGWKAVPEKLNLAHKLAH
jgi:hypothetical protein